MRRVRFTDPAGYTRTGTLTDNGITAAGRQFAVEDIQLLPPVVPEQVIGVGANYRAVETDDGGPDDPVLWVKGGPSVVAAPGTTIPLPGTAVVFEGELAVVIGEEGRNIAPADAMEYVAGFTIANDLSDLAHEEDPTVFRTKSFDNALPLGPVLVSPGDVPTDPRIRTWINGEQHQDSQAEELIYGVPAVIAAITNRVTLRPDDVIIMGSPSGAEPLNDGDTIRIEVEDIGTLEHRVTIHDATK